MSEETLTINQETLEQPDASTDEQAKAKLEESKQLLKALVEAGVHLGHETSSWNPKMADYIHSVRDGVHVINLGKTVNSMMAAAEYMKKQAKLGKNIVYVGTSKQSSEIIKQESERVGVFFINQRWLGGLVTNFETIRSRLNTLRDLESQRDTGGFKGFGKKEIARLNRQILKLERSLGGLKKMRGRPEVLFVVDQNKDSLAVTEAKKSKLGMVVLADTDCDPSGIDYVIPANNDSMRSIRVITKYISDAILEGKANQKKRR
jgi:small subunit ribosomal protein S2